MKRNIVKSDEISAFEETLDQAQETERQQKKLDEERYWSIVEKEACAIIENEGKNQRLDPKVVISKARDKVAGRDQALVKPSDMEGEYALVIPEPGLNGGLTLTELYNAAIASATENIENYTAENSKRAWAGDLAYWQAWRLANGIPTSEPYKKEHVILFVMQHADDMPSDVDNRLIEEGYKAKKGTHRITTIERRLASLSRYLRMQKMQNPCNDADISTLMQTLTKKHGSGRSWHFALTKDFLNDILETFREDTIIDRRDAALIFFGFSSGGRRRSEIASARFENLKEVGTGYVYTIPKSKTDQAGEGHSVPVVGRAALLLKNWLETANIRDGYIFRSVTKGGVVQEKRLSDIDVNRIVKKRIKCAGYNEKNFGAHSLRSGFVTESGRQRKPLGDTMALSGHRSVPTAMKYYQAGDVINNSAATLID